MSQNSQSFSLEDCLQTLTDINEPFSQHLIEVFQHIQTYQVKNFTDYTVLNVLKKRFDSLKTECSLRYETESENILEAIGMLEIDANRKTRKAQMDFVQACLDAPSLKCRQKLLFDNTREVDLKRRYQKLLLTFHPDKCFLFSVDQKWRLNRLFNLIQECHDDFMEPLNNKLAFFEEKGYHHWRISQEYKDGAARCWDKLKFLKKEEISGLSQDDLDFLRRSHIKMARGFYEICWKMSNKAKDTKNKIKFRNFIGLCFYCEGQYLEAQLSIWGALRLILKNPNIGQEYWDEANKILNKIKNRSTSMQNQNNQSNQSSQIPLDEIVRPLAEYSEIERKELEDEIQKTLPKVACGVVLRDCSLLEKQELRGIILKSGKAKVFKALGVLTSCGGAAGGLAGVLATAGEVSKTVGVTLMTTAGISTISLAAVAAGIFTLGLGICAGIVLWTIGKSLSQEPEIRENLNNILAKALQYHDARKYDEFFAELSKEYKPKQSVFILEKQTHPKSIIDCLLNHGFRPDGVVYLLNLIGEALLSGKIFFQGVKEVDLIVYTKQIFDACSEKRLRESAKNLDKRVYELRDKTRKNILLKIFYFILPQDDIEMAKQEINNSNEMPFGRRLDEMCLISKLNLATLHMLNGEMDEARKFATRVQDLVAINNVSNEKIESRLNLLNDCLCDLTESSKDVFRKLE